MIPTRATTICCLALTTFACSGSEPAPPAAAKPQGLRVEPRWLTFTCVEPGSCRTTKQAKLTPIGDRGVAIKRIVLSETDRDDFKITVAREAPFILAPGEEVEIQAEYVPNGDPRLGDLEIRVAYTDASAGEAEDRIEPGELLIPLVRRLIGEPILAVAPTRLVFGEVPAGASKTMPLSIQNSGFGNVGVVVDDVASDLGEVSFGSLPVHAVLPRQAFSLDVTFQTDEEIYAEGLIQVTSADRSADPAYVSVAATSITRPSLQTAPEDVVEFEPVALGGMAYRQVELINEGGEELQIFSITTQGNEALQVELPNGVETASVAPLGSIVATLTLDANTPGVVEGLIEIRSNDRARRTLELPVRGLVTQPQIAVTPLDVDFGITPRGWNVARSIEVRNTGYGPLVINNIAPTHGSSEVYTVRNLPPLPAALAHDERLAFEIEFRAVTEATFNGNIGIASNDMQDELVEVSVTGQGASCETGCPIANGTPSCESGECAVGDCNSGYYDTDGQAATGCECRELGRDPGQFCADSHWAGTLDDEDGDDAVFQGLLATDGDIDLITFFGKDSTGFFNDSYDVRVVLDSADPGIEMCVYRNNTSSHQNTCTFTNERCGRQYRNDGSFGAEDGADYIVRIRRTSSAAPTCTPYTVFMANG